MFTKTSLKTKLIFSFLIVAAILFGVGANGLHSLNQVDEHYSDVASVDMPNIIALGTIESETKDLVIRTFRVSQMQDPRPGEVLELEKLMLENHAAVNEAIKLYEGLPFSPGEADVWKNTKEKMETVHKVADDIIARAKSGKPDDFEYIKKTVLELPAKNGAFTAAMNKSSEFIADLAKKATDQAHDTTVSARYTMITGIVAGLIASLFRPSPPPRHSRKRILRR